jgi:hypothetical protein
MYEKIFEWLATIILIIGVAFTAVNIYPLNVYFSLLGNLMWLILGVLWKKNSLIVIQLVIVTIYIAGSIYNFTI